MADFCTITLLHVQEDKDWCDYVVGRFASDKLKLKVQTLNVNECDNPAEIEGVMSESFVAVLLTTCYFVDYMRSQRSKFASLLQTRDKNITTVIAATIDVSQKDLQEVAGWSNYDIDQWTIIKIEVNGSNIKNCISQILDITGTNANKALSRKVTNLPSSCGPGSNEQLDIIPRTVQKEGDKVALIFGKEKVKGSVVVHCDDIKLPVETLNPYCVTFLAPEIKGTKVLIQVDVNGTRLRPFKLYRRQSPQFTSLELMCQTNGVSSKNELDKLLAKKFTASMCNDPQAKMIFSRTPEGGRSNTQHPTLLHWAAANGLRNLCNSLLSSPGALEACQIQNCDGDDVADVAAKNNHNDLSDFITDFTETKQAVTTCDLYVSMKPRSTERGPEIAPPAVCQYRKQPDSSSDYVLVNESSAISDGQIYSSDEDELYVEPEPIVTKEALKNGNHIPFIEIQKEVKRGNFNKAQTQSSSWSPQYQPGNYINFEESQKNLQDLIEQNSETAVKSANTQIRKRGDGKEHVELRKKSTDVQRDSKDSQPRSEKVNYDSGFSSGKLSRSSLSVEGDEELNNRKSVTEKFIFPSRVLNSCPPPLPPRFIMTESQKSARHSS